MSIDGAFGKISFEGSGGEGKVSLASDVRVMRVR